MTGHRAIGALAVLLVFLLGATAFLPLGALGVTAQINGLVSTCGTTTPYVPGATVTLIDANGINAPRTATTDGAGVFVFSQPPTGSYTIAVSKSGYYSNATTDPQRFDGSRSINIPPPPSPSICMYPYGTPSKVLAVTVLNTGAPVSGATVMAFNVSNPTLKSQLIATNTTNAAGLANVTLWPASFLVRASAPDFQTDQTVDVKVTSSTTINLVATPRIFGHVQDSSLNFLGSGVVAWLYNPSAPSSSAYRLIPAAVSGSFYDLHAPAGTYTLIVDANGYLSHKETVMLTATPTIHDVVLQPAPPELYQTDVGYGRQDWNNITVWRNLTLNPDSTLPGLVPANLRDLRLQIDATLGNGDGILSGGEITAFETWIAKKGPAYVTTDGFLTTNGRAYNSTLTSFSVTVSPTLITPGARVWINSTTQYSIKQAPPYIAAGAHTYNVTLTMVPDSNVSVYQNYTYRIALPHAYELNTSTIVPSAGAPVTIANFTRITIDPGIPNVPTVTPQVRLTVSQSLNGTARAKVAAPTGKFYVKNATFSNYQAFVANDTNLTFSAEDTTDPNDHVSDANFTWHFTSTDVRYGIRPVYEYTQRGQFIVNLTVRETGGNLSYRTITLFVDDQLPIAKIKTNRTGTGSANGMTIMFDEGTIVHFDGGLSTDLAYPGTPGVILDSGYSWDFNGDRIADATGRVVDNTFRKPGKFTVNLTVTDSVGWKGANASMTVIVNDTKAPVPAFDILDPSKDYATAGSLMERKPYAFNASKTTDDYDKVTYKNATGLNFTWTIPGPIFGMNGTTHKFYGVNVSFAWNEWNNSYKVLLSVNDTGFGSGKRNTGNLTRNITVGIDGTLHADLLVSATTLKITPGDPEEGALVTVSVNVTNKAVTPAHPIASKVTAQLIAITAGVSTVVTTQADWLDKNGNPKANQTIASGETVTIVFHARLSGQGNKTLQVYIYDGTEPYTWLFDNRASGPVNVRQPWWQPYAIYGSVIGVIVLFVFGMYARRKIKAGEWRPIRGQRGERGGEEKEKPRKEAKEEKKRL